MTSRRLQALGFVRRYIGEHGASPSYGEIGAALGVTRERARDLVRSLVKEGKLQRASGSQRGISLPMPAGVASVADAIEQLRAAGFRVDEDALHLERAYPFTITPLRMIPDLDHLPPVAVGVTSDEASERPRGGPRPLSRARQRSPEGEADEAGPRAA